MGKDSAIGWCHHTFNPWWGCVEVSPACDFCYARIFAKRLGFDIWGKDADRRFFGDAHWNELLRWNRAADKAGRRARVFIASMADWGEQRRDEVGHAMAEARGRLWAMLPALTSLDFLFLTKRPGAYRQLMPEAIRALPNVWPGVTVESEAYRWRLEELTGDGLNFAGPLWVSYEPALGSLDLRPYMPNALWNDLPSWKQPELGWVVIGGESGSERAMDVADVRRTVQHCRAAGVPIYVKQDSARHPGQQGRIPDELWIHEFPG